MISGITHLNTQKSTTITAFTHLGIGSHLKYSLTKLKQSLTLLITFFIIVLTFLLHVVEYAYFLYYAYILYNYKIEKYKKKKRYMYKVCTYTFLLIIIPLSLYNSELFLLIPLHPSIVVPLSVPSIIISVLKYEIYFFNFFTTFESLMS